MSSLTDANTLLQVWERSKGQPAHVRDWLLLCAAETDVPVEELVTWSIGAVVARLLDWRDQLFGSVLACLAACPACAENVELTFTTADIRATHAAPDQRFEVADPQGTALCRLPTAVDLIALQDCTDVMAAARQLLARCVLELRAGPDGHPLEGEIPDTLATAIDRHMAELDPQAEVTLALDCPYCGHAWSAPFDIGAYLWRELDRWARRLLQEVHVLASRYGWAEKDILAMDPVRRNLYLDLIAG